VAEKVVTVELAGGRTLTGVVVEEHEDRIVLDVGFRTQIVYRTRIVKVTAHE
jgi:vacuolar-type H+-ATPase subunit E/Vma4